MNAVAKIEEETCLESVKCGGINDGVRLCQSNALEHPVVSHVDEPPLFDQLKDLCAVLETKCSLHYERCISPEVFDKVQAALYEHCGFCLQRKIKTSSKETVNGQPRRSIGVFVSKGRVPRNRLVAIFPGTVYDPGATALLQTVGNPFVFRCSDSTLVDGNDRALSKLIFRSCSLRDRHGTNLLSDMTWMTPTPANPLAVGQYVAFHASGTPNVRFKEIDMPFESFPNYLRRFIPNVPFNNVNGSHKLRLVLLVATRDITESEELLCSLK